MYFDLVDKLLVYEPNKRLTPYQAMCHAFFDELKKKDVQLPENKQLPTHLFEFKQCEIDFDKESINRIMEQINEKWFIFCLVFIAIFLYYILNMIYYIKNEIHIL